MERSESSETIHTYSTDETYDATSSDGYSSDGDDELYVLRHIDVYKSRIVDVRMQLLECTGNEERSRYLNHKYKYYQDMLKYWRYFLQEDEFSLLI